MGLEGWIVDFVMCCFFLGCIVICQGRWQLWMGGRVNASGNLPLITGFLTKEREFGLLLVYGWDKGSSKIDSYQRSKRVDWDMSLCFTSSSNIRIFEDKSADLTRQTYGDVRFDKSTIRHRIFEYSGSTESKCRSLVEVFLFLFLVEVFQLTTALGRSSQIKTVIWNEL